MAGETPGKTFVFKDLNDRREIKLDQPGTYSFGLSKDGGLCVETDEDTLKCVKLFQVTLQHDGGCLLAPLNRDLTCLVNLEELNKEMNLIHGTTLEIAEKKIVCLDSSVPRPRRHLPPTPGRSRVATPPPKPARSNVQHTGNQLPQPQHGNIEHTGNQIPQPQHGNLSTDTRYSHVDDDDSDDDDDKKRLAKSGVMSQLPSDHRDQLGDLTTPDQISILAASYFTKQLRMFTDAVVTGKLIDDIFKLFLDTVEDCKDSYMVYLNSVSRALSKLPDRSQNVPLHRPAIRLATDLLCNCFDPISRVTLIMSLLRTFSHFDNNLPIMILYQTTPAVMGTMTAFNNAAEVQQHGLDILSKIAVYAPKLGEKPPLKEVGIEQVIRAVNRHPDLEVIGRSACRVFANLSNTLISLLNHWLDSGVIDSQEKLSSSERIEMLQDIVFKDGISVAQTIVGKFSQNLGVMMDFRRFVRSYAIYQHYKTKKAKWLSQDNVEFQENLNTMGSTTVNGLVPSFNRNTSDLSVNKDKRAGSQFETSGDSVLEVGMVGKPTYLQRNNDKQTGSETDYTTDDSSDSETEDFSFTAPPAGILKKSRSYECLRTSERKLNFNSETVGGSDSDTSSSDSDILKFEAPFEPRMPVQVDMEDDFSFHLVRHLVKKSVRRKKSMLRHPECSESSSSDTDDSDREFLDSINYSAKPKTMTAYKPPSNNGEIMYTRGLGEDKCVSGESGNKDVKESKHNHLDERNGNGSHPESLSHEDNTTSKTTENPLLPETTVDQMSENTQMETHLGGSSDKFQRPLEPGILSQTGARRRPDGKVTYPDVKVWEKLVQTQVITHMIVMVFQDQDFIVLQKIDYPVKVLLQEAGNISDILEFAENQYGENMTLMDLEPSLVISVIDAVRYRAVAVDLLHSMLLSLMRALSNTTQTRTIHTVMEFYRDLFSNPHLFSTLTDKYFIEKLRQEFQKTTIPVEVEVPQVLRTTQEE